MGLVGQEGILVVADAPHVHPHHVEARHEHRREGYHHGVGLANALVGWIHRDPDAQQRQQDADGEAARVAHEYLLALLRVAEHIEIEERDEHAHRSHRQHRVEIVADDEERDSVDERGYGAQARGQAVDAVDEVERVDDEHHHHHREGHPGPGGDVAQPEDAVEIADPYSAEYEHDGANHLDEELGAVAHAHQVVGDAHQIQHQHGTEAEEQRPDVEERRDHHLGVAHSYIHADHEEDGEENHRPEGDATQTRHQAAVDLALVRLVEELTAESDKENLGDEYARAEYAQEKNCHAVGKPVVHHDLSDKGLRIKERDS